MAPRELHQNKPLDGEEGLRGSLRRYWFLVLLMAGFFTLLFVVVESFGIPILHDPSSWLEQGGTLAAVVGVGLLTVDVFLPVPSSVVMLLHGALFGVWLGMLLSLAGSMGAAVVGFALGRIGGPLLERLVSPAERAQADRLLERWGVLAIIITRPVPILAETVVILAGASPLSWGRAVAASLVGSLPAALLYALAGSTAARWGNGLLVFAAVLILAGIAWLVGRRIEVHARDLGR